MDDFDKGVDIDILRSRYAEGARNGDVDRVAIWAGAGVGLMSKVQQAKVRLQAFMSNKR